MAMPAAHAGAGEGHALVFDGVDDYMDAENIYEKLTQVTVEFWTWRTVSTIQDENFILGNSFYISYVQPITPNKAGFRFLKRLSPAGNIQFRVYEAEHDAGSLVTINTCPTEEWAHIVGVFDAGRNILKLYINGVEEVSDNAGRAAHTGVGDRFRIGQSTGVKTCIPGTIVDEVRIWNYVRTPEQIQESMNMELSGAEEGLVGYWKINEGDGVTVFDSSPNQNHGTIEGATWTTEAAPVAAFGFNAYRPDPPDGAEDVPRDVVLSWKPGDFAAPVNGHKVYFSENFNDVNDGIGGIAQDANSYTPPRLDFETTYYWRVDEVNGPPDYTVFEGRVWSFTTELFAYPVAIENIIATASSSDVAKGPENAVNSSGLDESGLLHGKDADDNMWLSGMAGPQPTWIEFQFDKIYKLHELWVWNSNSSLEPVIGLGFKDVSIEYSVDGTNYTTLGTTHEFARAPGAPDYAHNTTVDFGGVAGKYVRFTANSNWGSIFNQYGLSEVRFFYIPVNARAPYPDSGATGVDRDVTISFRAGREAAKHDVYLSTDEQAVIDGTAPVATVTEPSHGPLALDLAQTYYWKVNEVNEAETPSTWASSIWNFTTTDHLVVDDFESYNDLEPTEPGSKRVFNVWIDGYGIATNGSLVGYEVPPFCEQTIVHGGEQSMPFFYSNTGGAASSEAELPLSPAQDWTAAQVKTLAVHFHGAEGNTGQLYVKINGTKVPYDGQATNLAQAGWQAWNIDLASSGASLQNVTKLAVGIDGNGAAGTLYFDDIGLYPYERQFITPSAPDNARLIGHWKFDGDMQDSSGRGNHSTAGASAAFVTGKVGSNALDLRGADYVVIDGVVDDITSTDITISIWIKTTQSDEGQLVAANTAASDHPFMFGLQGGKPYVNDGDDTQFGSPVNDDLWHILTYVRSGSTGYVYADGALRGTYPAGFSLASVTRWSIGQEWDIGPSDFYTGAVDDVRFYDYPLSAGEVAWLAGKTQPFDKPF
jgi:hypothetical protein